MDHMKEEWKTVVNYEGLYLVSSLGRIMSIRFNKRKILKLYVNKYGYCKVGLTKKKKNHLDFHVHRLVAEMFIPNPDNKPFVNHIDGNKHNNDLSNLEWCTAKENTQHKINVLGKHTMGSNCGTSVLKENQVIDIKKRLKNGETNASIARYYKVSRPAISAIKTGKSWNHVII